MAKGLVLYTDGTFKKMEYIFQKLPSKLLNRKMAFYDDLKFITKEMTVEFEYGNIYRTKRQISVEWESDKDASTVMPLKIGDDTVYIIKYCGGWKTLTRINGYRSTYEIAGGIVVRFCT